MNISIRHSSGSRYEKGFTLLEMSLVIALIMVLGSVCFTTFASISNWRKAKDAGISLLAVYTAQKTFLADHPTCPTTPNISVNGAVITEAQLAPYLPGSTTAAVAAIPTAVDLNGTLLNIDYTVIPPVLVYGGVGGTAFADPTPSNDGLWDMGNR